MFRTRILRHLWRIKKRFTELWMKKRLFMSLRILPQNGTLNTRKIRSHGGLIGRSYPPISSIRSRSERSSAPLMQSRISTAGCVRLPKAKQYFRTMTAFYKCFISPKWILPENGPAGAEIGVKFIRNRKFSLRTDCRSSRNPGTCQG